MVVVAVSLAVAPDGSVVVTVHAKTSLGEALTEVSSRELEVESVYPVVWFSQM